MRGLRYVTTPRIAWISCTIHDTASHHRFNHSLPSQFGGTCHLNSAVATRHQLQLVIHSRFGFTAGSDELQSPSHHGSRTWPTCQTHCRSNSNELEAQSSTVRRFSVQFRFDSRNISLDCVPQSTAHRGHIPRRLTNCRMNPLRQECAARIVG